MKIVCYKDKILKAINSVVKAVASKTTMPILEGILIQTNDNEIKLTTYDLEIGIEYIMDCTVEEQGSTVVNAIMFSEIIRKLPDTEIKIYLDDNNLLVIECEGSLYKLATMDPTEFPELPKINIENSIQIEQNVLKNMIRRTIFAVSNEENRPIFTGCLFEVINNKLNVVAVDGFRLAWRSSYLNVQANDFSAVIPGKTLNEVNKIISDSFEPIKIGISKNQALFDMDNCKIVTRVLDGEFLNYANVIPNEYTHSNCIFASSLYASQDICITCPVGKIFNISSPGVCKIAIIIMANVNNRQITVEIVMLEHIKDINVKIPA